MSDALDINNSNKNVGNPQKTETIKVGKEKYQAKYEECRSYLERILEKISSRFVKSYIDPPDTTNSEEENFFITVEFFERKNKLPEAFYVIMKPLIITLYKLWYNPHIQGKENIPKNTAWTVNKEGGIETNTFPMAAAGPDFDFTFSSPCGILKVPLYSEGSSEITVGKIELRDNTVENPIAGTLTVNLDEFCDDDDFNYQNLQFDWEDIINFLRMFQKKVITLNCPEGVTLTSNAKDFYFVVPTYPQEICEMQFWYI